MTSLKKKNWKEKDQIQPSIIGEWKGHAVYDQENFSPNTKVVVITKNGQMPWRPVSQLQYLQALRSKKENEKLKAIADFDAGIEKAKKVIEEIRTSLFYRHKRKDDSICTASPG